MVVAGGDDGELLMNAGRLFQLWQCVRSDRANREDFPLPPTHFIFIFLFILFFFEFFMFTIFGIPERRKKKEESSQRPATRIFVRSRNSHCFNLKFTFSCGLPT